MFKPNKNYDNYILRSSCLKVADLQIIGLAETHLVGNEKIDFDGYQWFGKNRKSLHVNAKVGSGGVGFLIRDDIMNNFTVTVLDDTCEGILWLKLQRIDDENDCFCICVCYLPPENSTRAINANEFFDTLITQIYSYQNNAIQFICGGFNGRCSDMEDYIAGVDILSDRNVIDFKCNRYGELFIEFLINVNFCMLNGRNYDKNDFTCFTSQGQSVVDYCLVGYENIQNFHSFNVIRPRDLVDMSGCLQTIDPRTSVPDHALLKWIINIPFMDYSNSSQQSKNCVEFTRYDLKSIPLNFMQSIECQARLNEAILRLETSSKMQTDINDMYSDFVSVVKMEMNQSLNPIHIRLQDSASSNKRRRSRKPWWTEELSRLWNDMCSAEKKWRKEAGVSRRKTDLKKDYLSLRKTFDQTVQRTKRHYWFQIHLDIDNLDKNNSQEFWKTIGKIGVGNERRKNIPFEVEINGQITRDNETVLDTWKNSFRDLLNPVNVTSNVAHSDADSYTNFDFNSEITRYEVSKAISRAKKGKSAGIDEIPTDVLKNDVAIDILHRLFFCMF